MGAMQRVLSALLLLSTVAGSGLSAATPVAAAEWLDAPLVRWNGPHQGVPQPPVQTNTRTGQPLNPADAFPSACFLQGRAPVTEEEKLVAGAGWLLRTYWPTLQWADVTVITAPSWFDGMCRPAAYQPFTFVGGRFTGTLSPEPMTSRLDGSLFGGHELKPGPVIEASFLRYADTDPLCCPSLPRVELRYELVGVEGRRVFTPTAARQVALPEAGGTKASPDSVAVTEHR